ncbi:L-sorbosone dehydrogenase [Hyella patelloides LEGE 07179]|uniref:L-sorbosone dehydrogenase n=1 Tax=Hyella patelloides LEGE 07179 TaxID=945734 RepID=A0A563W0V7_9CYAN|nr:sorbosone dehydrogenase family protein [Hyella patelloides]VEP17328.1 L-sorbosone dehydrogenase [Hyella patelloides LEGE 07179]
MSKIFGTVRISYYGLLLFSTIACTAESAQQGSITTDNKPSFIQTEVLEVAPKSLEIKDLPQPYETESASRPPKTIAIPKNPTLQVPQGFKVNVFATNVNRPQWMALTPEGDVVVAESYYNRLLLLQDQDENGVAETSRVFATNANGINQPLGMAFTDDSFYVANTENVLRFDYQPGQKALTGEGTEITQLTPGGYNQNWTRNLVIAPEDQKLYVSVGSRSNVESEALPRASIQVMNLDGSARETYANGLRNPVGMDFHPVTQELYTTVNERELLGDNLVPDYFTRVEQGGFYGWPYAYLTPQLLDPRRTKGGVSERADLAAKTVTPDVLFQAHSAAFGLQFYDGQQFPERYRNGAFVAFRGSWNRSRGTGYKVVFVPFGEDNRPLGYYEDFLQGFLKNPTVPTTWGLPVGLLVLPDGSLLLAEDGNSVIYRISY